MKDIVYCRTENEWDMELAGADDLVAVPQTSTVIPNYPESLYRELDSIPIIGRLNRIKQLGLASYCRDSVTGNQTRYGHSLILATKADYLAQNMKLDRTLAVTAAMMHDIATPPFSDSVAKAFNISDEKLFEQVLYNCPEAIDFLHNHDIDPALLGRMVRGEDDSLVGQIINSQDSIDVDRWAYVTGDAWALDRLPRIWSGRYVADPFKNVVAKDGKIIFTDFDSVRHFLEARTQMFEQIYRNDRLLAKEAFAARFAKELADKNMIDERKILRMTDLDFQDMISSNTEHGYMLFQIDGFDKYGSFDADELLVREKLNKMTDRPFEVKHYGKHNPATGTPVKIDRKILSYEHWEPKHSSQLRERLSAWNKTFVYGYEDDAKLGAAVVALSRKIE